jgi:hypothetical protein
MARPVHISSNLSVNDCFGRVNMSSHRGFERHSFEELSMTLRRIFCIALKVKVSGNVYYPLVGRSGLKMCIRENPLIESAR